jgi:hypothetical protein
VIDKYTFPYNTTHKKRYVKFSDGTVARNQRSGHSCVRADNEPMEAPERASFCAVSKGVLSVNLVLKISADESDCGFQCSGMRRSRFCSVDTKVFILCALAHKTTSRAGGIKKL